MTRQEQIEALLSDPQKLKMKKPFTRGADRTFKPKMPKTARIAEQYVANPPKYREYIITQEQYARELDLYCHDVLFDDNIPAFCVKLADGSYYDVKFEKVALPIQRIIKDKQVMHLCGNKMQFTLLDSEPTETQSRNFITFKKYWDLRNQDGMKRKFVDAQKSYGDAGLLYYFNEYGQIKSRLISFADGYTICSHSDQNGERLVESINYYDEYGNEVIDSYDDLFMTRWTCKVESTEDNTGWVRHAPIAHGFKECPLITKRGKVAWEEAQSAIPGYEALYNIFLIVQKKYGNGILYIKGKFNENTKKIAGSFVLNDSSLEGNGDAKFLEPPTPQNMIDTLTQQFETIQLSSKTTFILPKDIKTGGDLSGLAVQLTREMDILNAEDAVIEWQNVADKMQRLFKYGLSKELVETKENEFAVTEFDDLRISAKFKVWRPFNEYEFNQMITILKGAGVLSKETSIELNTLSKPDEKMRIAKEEEEAEKKLLAQQQATAAINNKSDNDNNDNNQLKEE